MQSLKDQLAIRAKLQALEDEWAAQGKRHVIARTDRGSFAWSLPEALNEPAEVIENDELVAIEQKVVSQGWDDIMVATERGTWCWERG